MFEVIFLIILVKTLITPLIQEKSVLDKEPLKNSCRKPKWRSMWMAASDVRILATSAFNFFHTFTTQFEKKNESWKYSYSQIFFIILFSTFVLQRKKWTFFQLSVDAT